MMDEYRTRNCVCRHQESNLDSIKNQEEWLPRTLLLGIMTVDDK